MTLPKRKGYQIRSSNKQVPGRGIENLIIFDPTRIVMFQNFWVQKLDDEVKKEFMFSEILDAGVKFSSSLAWCRQFVSRLTQQIYTSLDIDSPENLINCGAFLDAVIPNLLNLLKKSHNDAEMVSKAEKVNKEVLVDWYMKNLKCPYPTLEQKVMLCNLSGMSKDQVDWWFINKRNKEKKKGKK